MPHINSYGKILTAGHAKLENLLDGEVSITEKIDGSQISVAMLDGELRCRSKGAELYVDNPEKMFDIATATAIELKDILTPGYIYRCEYLRSPKHNTLAYDRVPNKHLIVFDIEKALGTNKMMCYSELKEEAARIGLEVVPELYAGVVNDVKDLLGLLETPSILGGQKIEGFVIKNYNQFDTLGEFLKGKVVSEDFKEVHAKEWKVGNPGRQEVVESLIETYRTPARWNKAIQHLKERGELQEAPQDIGNLMKEVNVDTYEECADEIREVLFKHFWPQISRGITRGLAEWYKRKLLGLEE